MEKGEYLERWLTNNVEAARQWPRQQLATGGDGNSAASGTEIASNSEIIHLTVMVKVTASGDGDRDSRSKGNNQPGVRRNSASVWETAQRPVMVTTTNKKIF